jgi:hypothetical protein
VEEGVIKRRSLLVLALALLVTLAPRVDASTIEDEQWPIPNEFAPGHHSVLIEDPVTGLGHSQLTGSFGENSYLCSSLEDPNCSKATNFNYDILLPVCSEQYPIDCIRSLEAIHPDGRIDQATFKRYTHTNHPNSFVGSRSRGIPDPLMPSLWEFPDTKHSQGKEFGVAVGMSGSINANAAKGTNRDFFINLHPVSLKLGNGGNNDVNGYANYSKCQQYLDAQTGRSYIGCGSGAEDFGNYKCAFKLQENGNCLLRHAFPSDVEFRVTVDLSEEPNGWFHGRMKDPEILINNLDSGALRLSVTAKATRQPVFYWGKSYSEMSSDQKRIWDECVPKFDCYNSTRIPWSFPNREPDGNKRNVQFYARPTGEKLIEFMKQFLKETGDKAVVVPSAWNIRALSAGEMSGSTACFAKGAGVKGVVTTNATVYTEGPPRFDGSTLQYRVAAPHYTPQGDEFRGSYNLVMKSEVARCLYGFTEAPINASIEVFGEGGEKSVATTIVGEREGWLYLAAHNFTFSSPTIKATISQAKPVSTPSPSPNPSSTTTPAPTSVLAPALSDKAAVTRTIRCQKGNKTRKVTDVKPKCPKGWNKA